MGKHSLEEEVNKFLELWDLDQIRSLLGELAHIYELYDVGEDDWVQQVVGDEEDARLVRLIRTVYLVSRLADFHAGRLVRIRTEFRGLWKRMEDQKCVEVQHEV